jgi:hypothetical protein
MYADALLTTNQIQEALSGAYLQAIAARLGYTATKPVPDMAGIDFHIGAGGELNPQIDVQLKSTFNATFSAPTFNYVMEVSAYHKLRKPCVNPRILVLYIMPPDESLWLDTNADRLKMRHCCFWKSLAGAPDTSNSSNITISMDATKTFDAFNLHAMMQRVRLSQPI